MASNCDSRLLTRRVPLWLPALVLTMMWPSSVTESSAVIQLRGEVGGKVTFRCPVPKRTFLFVYIQKGNEFINGYHASRNISQQSTWNNTRMDRDKTTMHMFNLTMSHSGDYQCHIRYNEREVVEFAVHLTVTAPYSTPVLTVACREENHHSSCRATCAAHGGYPASEVLWNVSGSPAWTVVNSSTRRDPDTMVVNSSSTAHINCSDGGPAALSCSVGTVTSDTVSVCDQSKSIDKPDSHSLYVTAAICVLVVVGIIVASLVWWKRKKEHRRDPVVDVKVNGPEAVTMLGGGGEEKEAS